MEAGSPDPAPVLVLGIGNLLLGDDGAGLAVLAELQRRRSWPAKVEFMDGGTQGLALLGALEGREAVLILDAVGLGSPAGNIHVLDGLAACGIPTRKAGSAHEGNATEILSAARLLGIFPPQLVIVGIEPEEVRTGIGLSSKVEEKVAAAASAAAGILTAWIG